MRIWEKLKAFFGFKPRPESVAEAEPRPLREFIYLDEVSLLSLLSSQKGEVTEGTSEQLASGIATELAGKLGASPPGLGTAEMTSKFQTSNSSTIQTSRKATVQSWFRELHAIPGLRMIEPMNSVPVLSAIEDVAGVNDLSLVARAQDLRRGSLVEFRVRLTADYVFHLGTMAEEFAGIAEDFPAVADTPQAKAILADTTLVSRLLQRLLAGLIPIRCEAVDHVVVGIGGIEYVVRQDVVASLGLKHRRLELVGVTEHLAYWKDIRRVLFSSAECHLLARVARTGLQDSWTPVKLADLFQPIAPDLVEQITRASRDPFTVKKQEAPILPSPPPRGEMALLHYRRLLMDGLDSERRTETEGEVYEMVTRWAPHMLTPTGQRSAFAAIRSSIETESALTLTAEDDLALRERARELAGLSFFAGEEPEEKKPILPAMADPEGDSPRLLDVEVIAIYW